MKDLNISASDGNPEVSFKASGSLTMSGRALPEDAVAFFTPLKDWLTVYGNSPEGQTVFEMDLEYFNSSASRQIIEMLIQLEEMSAPVKVVWKYKKDDELMQYRGEELESFVDLSFEYISY